MATVDDGPDEMLIKRTQMFLVPLTILVNALAHADNERLKTGVSALSLVVVLVWWATVGQLRGQVSRRFGPAWLTTHALPGAFAVASVIALIVHAYRWSQLP